MSAALLEIHTKIRKHDKFNYYKSDHVCPLNSFSQYTTMKKSKTTVAITLNPQATT